MKREEEAEDEPLVEGITRCLFRSVKKKVYSKLYIIEAALSLVKYVTADITQLPCRPPPLPRNYVYVSRCDAISLVLAN